MSEIYTLETSRLPPPRLLCNLANTLQCLEDHQPRDFVWFDNFHQKLRTKTQTGETREWTDRDTLTLTVALQKEFGLARVSEDTVLSAVCAYANSRERNEVMEYLESLQWDGISRIEAFFNIGLGAEQNLYTAAASRNFWIAAAARTYRPGCKFDNLIVFEGDQGTYKSTALSIIGGPWYADVSESIESKDFALTFPGKLLVEISELQAFSKSSVNLLKKTLSTLVDRFRPPYAKAAQDFPRRCILVGTTNDIEYLRDVTGNRRFWPVKTGKINLDLIRKDRDQLFAEGVFEFKKGTPWWDMPEIETQFEQEARRESDPWEEPLASWIVGRRDCSAAHALKSCFFIDPAQQKQGDKLRVSRILQRFGWKPVRGSDPKTRERLWRRP